MRLVKVAIGEIGVIGGDKRQPVTIGQLDEAGLAAGLLRRPVAH